MASELLLARLVIGVVFLLAGGGKLRSPRAAREAVLAYEVLPRPLAGPVAALLPYAELLIGGLCLAGLLVPVAGAAAGVLLVAFTAAMSVNLRRGRRLPCYCFGSSGASIGWPLVARNLILLALALAVVIEGVHAYMFFTVPYGLWPGSWRTGSEDALVLAPLAAGSVLLVLYLLTQIDSGLFSLPVGSAQEKSRREFVPNEHSAR